MCNIGLNLLLQPVLGVAGLGIASTVNSIIVAVAILITLGLLRSLALDMLWLLGTSAVYSATWTVLTHYLTPRMWMPPVVFTVYWLAAAMLVPLHRRVIRESWRLIRAPPR